MDGTYSLVNDDCKITISGKTIDISTKTKDSNRVVTCYYNNICYISLYELLTPFDYIATVDIGANKVNILKHSTNMPNSQLAKTTATKSAYIRLEDIAEVSVLKRILLHRKRQSDAERRYRVPVRLGTFQKNKF